MLQCTIITSSALMMHARPLSINYQIDQVYRLLCWLFFFRYCAYVCLAFNWIMIAFFRFVVFDADGRHPRDKAPRAFPTLHAIDDGCIFYFSNIQGIKPFFQLCICVCMHRRKCIKPSERERERCRKKTCSFRQATICISRVLFSSPVPPMLQSSK